MKGQNNSWNNTFLTCYWMFQSDLLTKIVIWTNNWIIETYRNKNTINNFKNLFIMFFFDKVIYFAPVLNSYNFEDLETKKECLKYWFLPTFETNHENRLKESIYIQKKLHDNSPPWVIQYFVGSRYVESHLVLYLTTIKLFFLFFRGNILLSTVCMPFFINYLAAVEVRNIK